MNGLPALANNLAAQGRGPDRMLVHMSPREVGGLQSLAMAHGGSLTINPHTGLPEAGFLDNILPTVLGLGASFLFPGASPWLIGGGIGAIEGIRKKDLGAGLLAGLGAAGGAGIGEALGSGAASAAAPVADATLAEGAPQVAGLTAQPAPALGTGITTPPVTATTVPTEGLGASVADKSFSTGAQGFTGTGSMGVKAPGFPAPTTVPGPGAGTGPTGFIDRFSNVMGGPKYAAAAGFGMAAPHMQAEPMKFPEPEDPYANYKGPIKPSERKVSYPGERSSREWMYFDPSNPIPYAEGGETTDRAIKRPGADYDVNKGEWNYNFQPVEIAKPASDRPTPLTGKGAIFNHAIGTIGGKGSRGSAPEGMSLKDAKKYGYDKYTSLEGLKYDPETQRLVKMAQGGAVPMLEDGGFVLTKKALDGIGAGSNERGQKMAAAGLGAIPIKGKGTGTSDSIKTSIEGKVPARVSNGEAYVPRRNVKKAGGAQALYSLMKKAERKA